MSRASRRSSCLWYMRTMPVVRRCSSLRRTEILQHQRQGFVQLQPVSGGV
jgi:hypothetical protein